MNLILTTKCNKGCSFCFATQKNIVHQEVQIEDIQKILNFVKKSRYGGLKLLGGEPTLHPQFVRIIEMIEAEKLRYGLISNILFDNDILQALMKSVKSGTTTSLLANASELDKNKKHEDTFVYNYNQLLDFSKKNRTDFHLSCSVTLDRKKSVDEEVQYIEGLISKVDVLNLRLSLDLPGGVDEDRFFIKNKTYGEKVKAVMEVCLKNMVPMNWDCILYPCMFEDEFFLEKKVAAFIKKLQFICDLRSAPLDVFPDMSFIHCYPAENFGGDNILAYENIEELQRELFLRKKVLEYNKPLPEECKECKFYKQGKCKSLCLGCQSLERNAISRFR